MQLRHVLLIALYVVAASATRTVTHRSHPRSAETAPNSTAGREEKKIIKEKPDLVPDYQKIREERLNKTQKRHHDHDGELEADLPAIVGEHELEGHRALDSVHGVAKHVVVPGCAILMFSILAAAWLGYIKRVALIPDSFWTVAFSVVFGLFIRQLINGGVITSDKMIWASATFLNLFLLPIIIFQSGWMLNHLNFLSQIEYVGIFAVLGTLMSFLFVGSVGYYVGTLGWIAVTEAREHFVFAALIVATDPVATLATFSKLGLDESQPLLHTMIFGESVINDAVAIVLFHTINMSWVRVTWAGVIYDILMLLFGSAGFGILCASALVWILRKAHLPGDTVPEVIYIVVSAWLIFAGAESVRLSGIIANLCAGSIFRVYGGQHLEHKGQEMATEFLEVAAHMCDTMVFIICGAATALIRSFRGIQFAMCGLVLCLVARALSTCLCANMANLIKSVNNEPPSHYLTPRYQAMMWHAGLRGGIALVLALEIDADWCTHKATIINATFVIIACTLLFLGSTCEPVLKALGFIGNENEESSPTSSHATRASSKALVEDCEEHNVQKIKRDIMQKWDTCFSAVLVGESVKNRAKRKDRKHFTEGLKDGNQPAQRLHNFVRDHVMSDNQGVERNAGSEPP